MDGETGEVEGRDVGGEGQGSAHYLSHAHPQETCCCREVATDGSGEEKDEDDSFLLYM